MSGSEFEKGIEVLRRLRDSDDQKEPQDSSEAQGESNEETIARLAKLRPLDYDKVRTSEAERLGGVRLDTLDREVAKVRDAGEAASGAKGSPLDFEDLEPWPEPVDGETLLDDVADTFRRYVVLPTHAAEIQALWVAVAHVFDAFQISPRLNVTAPERGCGKTVNLDVISTLVPRPISTENISIASFFRLAETYAPTFLMDEYDTYLAVDKSGDLRGALNAGHRRGGLSIRCVGDDSEPRGFRVFAPVALGGIRELPGTLHDRL